MQTILIMGATSSIAQACIHAWAQQGQVGHVICIARNAEKLKAICADLYVRFPQIGIQQHIIDFREPNAVRDCIATCFAEQPIDQALIVQGSMYHSEAELTHTEIANLLQINTTSMAVSTHEVFEQMRRQGHGKMGVIGSVAGDRGRKANYLYGASKAFIATYVEGMQHKAALEHLPVTVSLIKPGPTTSAMTQHLLLEGKKLADVDRVAKEIVTGVQAGKRVIYTPKIWRFIMLVIRHLPFFVFKKMDI